ncbi:MAG: histidine phosphatase family protein, partial [Bradyrhizobium sp.]
MSHIRLLLLVLLGFFSAMVVGQSIPAQADWLEQIRLGGYVIVLRHGATTSDVKTDPMSNPTKQAAASGERQLSDA